MAVIWTAGQHTDTPFGRWSVDLYHIDDQPVEVSIHPSEILAKARPGETIVTISWLRPFALEFQGLVEEAAARYPELAAAGAFG